MAPCSSCWLEECCGLRVSIVSVRAKTSRRALRNCPQMFFDYPAPFGSISCRQHLSCFRPTVPPTERCTLTVRSYRRGCMPAALFPPSWELHTCFYSLSPGVTHYSLHSEVSFTVFTISTFSLSCLFSSDLKSYAWKNLCCC